MEIMRKTQLDVLKLAACFFAILSSFYIYFTCYGEVGLSAYFREEVAYLIRVAMLIAIGFYIGLLVTITLKNDIKRYQSGILLSVSMFFLCVYLRDVFTYLQQPQHYLFSTIIGFIAGFAYSWKNHPKEGACIFSEEPYKRQQKIVNLAAVVPSVYIVLVFILVGLAKGGDVYFLSNLFLGLVLGAFGLYEFIKVDVGSTNVVILGESSSGKSVLIASLYGFMSDSKYQKNYRNPVSSVSKELSEYLGATSLEEQDPSHRYYSELKPGRGWGKPTERGCTILFGTKVKILPKLYKCIWIVFPDYPGGLTAHIAKVLQNKEIVKLIPKTKDIEKNVSDLKELAKKLMGNYKEKLEEARAKALAVILTLTKNSDKIFYLVDSEKLIINLLEKNWLNLRDQSLRDYFIYEVKKRYRELGRELDFLGEISNLFNLRHEIYSAFGKDLNLVLTKADLIDTVSHYLDGQQSGDFSSQYNEADLIDTVSHYLDGQQSGDFSSLFKEFSHYFSSQYNEFEASSCVLRILERFVGPRIVNEFGKNFAISGVLSRIDRDPEIKILPQGGRSADEFIRIETFINLFER
ncbi:MAG: hypothetical protein QW540_10560 [Archaeoglobaceae archaeon]